MRGIQKIAKVKRLGLGNDENVYGNKSLSVRFVSCNLDNENFNLTFEVEAYNLDADKAILYVAENEVFGSEEAVTTNVTINPNGKRRVTVSFSRDKTFSWSWFEGDFEFIATISCDGLSHTSDEFKLKCAKTQTKSSINDLPLKEVICPPLNLTDTQKAKFIAVVLSESSHGFESLWDIAWVYFSRVSDKGFESGLSGSVPYSSKNSNYRLWMYYLGYGNEYKDYNYQGNGKLSDYIKNNGWFTTKILPRAKKCIEYIKKYVFADKPRNKYKGWHGQGYWGDINFNPDDGKGDQWYMAREYYLLQTENKVSKKLIQILVELNGDGKIKDQTTFIFDVVGIEKFFKDNPKMLPNPENVKKYNYGDGKSFKR